MPEPVPLRQARLERDPLGAVQTEARLLAQAIRESALTLRSQAEAWESLARSFDDLARRLDSKAREL